MSVDSSGETRASPSGKWYHSHLSTIFPPMPIMLARSPLKVPSGSTDISSGVGMYRVGKSFFRVSAMERKAA